MKNIFFLLTLALLTFHSEATSSAVVATVIFNNSFDTSLLKPFTYNLAPNSMTEYKTYAQKHNLALGEHFDTWHLLSLLHQAGLCKIIVALNNSSGVILGYLIWRFAEKNPNSLAEIFKAHYTLPDSKIIEILRQSDNLLNMSQIEIDVCCAINPDIRQLLLMSLEEEIPQSTTTITIREPFPNKQAHKTYEENNFEFTGKCSDCNRYSFSKKITSVAHPTEQVHHEQQVHGSSYQQT